MTDRDLEQFMAMSKNKHADLDKELDELMEDDEELRNMMKDDSKKNKTKNLENLDDSIDFILF